MDCLKCSTQLQDEQYCECDGCKQKIHYACTELTASEIKCVQLKNKRTLKFFCEACQEGLRLIPVLQKRIRSLEDKLDKLIDNVTSLSNQKEEDSKGVSKAALNYEEIITEIEERKNRAKNVMLFNVTESPNSDTLERNKHDKLIVENLIRPLIAEPENKIKKILRIGKPGVRTRPIKLIMQDADTALNILKNKNRVNHAQIKINSDMTINQRNYLKELRSELDRRKQMGEADLTIKYIHGIPKIMKTDNNRKN